MLVDIHEADKMGNVYTLLEPNGIRVIWGGKLLIVPHGFQSDGASVPRFFWRLVFPACDTKALWAAFAHDYVYRTHPEGWTKAKADEMFYDLLVEHGVKVWRAWLAYKGVDWFGFYAWKTKGGTKNA